MKILLELPLATSKSQSPGAVQVVMLGGNCKIFLSCLYHFPVVPSGRSKSQVIVLKNLDWRHGQDEGCMYIFHYQNFLQIKPPPHTHVGAVSAFSGGREFAAGASAGGPRGAYTPGEGLGGRGGAYRARHFACTPLCSARAAAIAATRSSRRQCANV